MPTYKFRDKDTLLEFEKFMSISAREQFLLDNPNYETCVNGAPMVCDPVRVGVTKKDTGFKEVLQKIHQKTAGSMMHRNNSW